MTLFEWAKNHLDSVLDGYYRNVTDHDIKWLRGILPSSDDTDQDMYDDARPETIQRIKDRIDQYAAEL